MSALLLVALVVLILINGFFVAAEFALVRVRRGRIESAMRAEEDPTMSQRVLHQVDQIDHYLSACQLGITMASIAIGFLGEPAVAELIEPAFGGISHGVAVTISVLIAYILVTALHITVGEQVPKMYAITNAETTAKRVAFPLTVFRSVAVPGIWALNSISNAMVRRLGVDPGALEERHTSEDFLSMFRMSAEGGSIDREEAEHLAGVFHLHEQQARQVMTPIPAVVTVDAGESVEAALRRCVASGHTRLVATEDDNPDKVRGIVHSNSLARLYMSDGPEASIESLIRDVPIVPETRALDDLLRDLQGQRTSLAVVIDEYGRTIGIVTIEDILEEVVGEIEDETDPRSTSIRRLVNGDWFVRGHVSLADLKDEGIALPIEDDAFNSIGGYVFSTLGRLPKRGDSIEADGFTIRVESVREHRIEAVRIHADASG